MSRQRRSRWHAKCTQGTRGEEGRGWSLAAGAAQRGRCRGSGAAQQAGCCVASVWQLDGSHLNCEGQAELSAWQRWHTSEAPGTARSSMSV